MMNLKFLKICCSMLGQVLFLSLFCFSVSAQAALYKCQGEDKVIRYRTSPCPGMPEPKKWDAKKLSLEQLSGLNRVEKGVALIEAVVDGDSNFVSQLLSVGADANFMDRLGMTPIHYATRRTNVDIVEMLINNGARLDANQWRETTLFQVGSVEIAELLIAKGVDVNARDNKGATALHSAAPRENKINVVKLLIAEGADINARDNEGDSPLSVALKTGNTAVAELLRQHGAR